jgi:hypothetical protein
MVCGAKRIRSLYLPLVRERLPGLSTTSPPQGRASFSTINAAITPRRDVFADQTSVPLRIHRGWLVPGLSRGSRVRSRWFVHNAG